MYWNKLFHADRLSLWEEFIFFKCFFFLKFIRRYGFTHKPCFQAKISLSITFTYKEILKLVYSLKYFLLKKTTYKHCLKIVLPISFWDFLLQIWEIRVTRIRGNVLTFVHINISFPLHTHTHTHTPHTQHIHTQTRTRTSTHIHTYVHKNLFC